MEPLFLAVTCGCQAGLFRDALHEVYLPRIQRGDASFAAQVLGAWGALVSILIHFFERGRWGFLLATGAEGQKLTAEDQLFILMQAGLYLTDDGMRDYVATGATLHMPYLLAVKAETWHLADRTPEALAAIREAEALVESSEVRWWCAELHRLWGVFLAAMGVGEGSIETAFCAAIRIANEQKSKSLAMRAEATYAEYRSSRAEKKPRVNSMTEEQQRSIFGFEA